MINVLLAFAAGIAFWTLMEYVLHRFLGHVHKGKNFFKHEHLQHHYKVNYFAPAFKKAIASLVVSAVLVGLLSLLMAFSVALAFIVGLIGMYGLYELIHFRFHSTDPLAMVFIVFRKHHFYHHFHNPKSNFGVTTRFWDRVFCTFYPVEMVVVPRKMPLKWLMAEEGIKDSYTKHFRIS